MNPRDPLHGRALKMVRQRMFLIDSQLRDLKEYAEVLREMETAGDLELQVNSWSRNEFFLRINPLLKDLESQLSAIKPIYEFLQDFVCRDCEGLGKLHDFESPVLACHRCDGSGLRKTDEAKKQSVILCRDCKKRIWNPKGCSFCNSNDPEHMIRIGE